MATKARKPRDRQAEKKQVGLLVRKGLYKPKRPRAAVTDYGKRLLKTFGDVLTGKASVVTVKPAKQKGRRAAKGFKAAAEFRSGKSVGTVRAVRNKVVLPTQAGEVARFSPKTGKVRVTRRGGAKEVYVREPLPRSVRTLTELRKRMKPGERVAVPLLRGRRGVEWHMMTIDDFAAFTSSGGSGANYANVFDYIELFHLEGQAKDLYDEDEPEETAALDEEVNAPVAKRPRKKPSKRGPRKSWR